MRNCPCGGTRVKHTRIYMLTSHDVKVRMRCTKCGSWKSVYERPDGTYSTTPRKNGRPYDLMVEA